MRRRFWKLIRWIMGHRILFIPKPVSSIFYPEYGLLYNGYTGIDVRKITSSDDWTLPTAAQMDSLKTYLSSNGGKLKEVGLTHWYPSNVGATNEFGFNARGSGARNEATGAFASIGASTGYWAGDTGFFGPFMDLSGTSTTFGRANVNRKRGYSLRAVMDATGITDGTTTTYTGNNGKVYSAIAINQVYWTEHNLAETKFRTGAIIPWYGADPANYFTNAEWAALTTAGCCAYNNTLSNVAPGFTFPT